MCLFLWSVFTVCHWLTKYVTSFLLIGNLFGFSVPVRVDTSFCSTSGDNPEIKLYLADTPVLRERYFYLKAHAFFFLNIYFFQGIAYDQGTEKILNNSEVTECDKDCHDKCRGSSLSAHSQSTRLSIKFMDTHKRTLTNVRQLRGTLVHPALNPCGSRLGEQPSFSSEKDGCDHIGRDGQASTKECPSMCLS